MICQAMSVLSPPESCLPRTCVASRTSVTRSTRDPTSAGCGVGPCLVDYARAAMDLLGTIVLGIAVKKLHLDL